MSDIVIREVAPGVVTFSKPFKRMGVLPVGGRTTALSISDGSVFVFASTPLSPETKSKIQEMGEVKTIAVPDFVHMAFTKEYSEAYPQARIIGPEGTSKKLGLKAEEFSGKKDEDAKLLGEGAVAREIKAEYFGGFVNKDIAFLHVPSKTLIQADLVFNLPPTEQHSKSSEPATSFLSKFFSFTPQSTFHKRFVYTLGAKDKQWMARSTAVVDGWDFERIIPCHGDVIEKDGKAAWKSAYQWYYDDLKAAKTGSTGGA